MSRLLRKARKMASHNATKSKSFYKAIKKPLGKMQRLSKQIFKGHYPVTANAPNFDFLTRCRKFKRRENRDSDMKILLHPTQFSSISA